ncbi:LysE family translocator [Epibacterium sp. Ofav1-8]|uniref:LysE family translocator n=1 Tax=Epibacterium sp. Ofav1-8 TaxID=2917735 RepID=UPI001EF61FF1|nr:LysE family translocator [Epibacterium sp. Ofav1-8]MCG7623569.1 LysE family translocator [Epibacterium sp. Ofav1-8]
MTLTIWDLAIYASAVFVLFLTPGPVWLALVARSMAGGFHAGWPLAFGVAVGDVFWPLIAVVGVSSISAASELIAVVLKGVAVVMFLVMGISTIRGAGQPIAANRQLTRPGRWAGFVAGVIVILGNPKAALFYMGILPGFFDLTVTTAQDIAAIVAVSMAVPLIGNVILAGCVSRVRLLLSSPTALRRMNLGAGYLLIAVACIIPFT